ncbi:EcsC family protein [Microvirga sp. VF16]|uniref:EcsC family protein n=1 Tax=Microvirga sp. VF16 TaxID=2807101 RepID=UPI00193D6944|nr:EcsC family protein [Microvirga sp. VF16]QRM29044.1 EcsC family protein [Microvirga sp. VF16]
MSQDLRRQEPLPVDAGRPAMSEIALSAEDREALRRAVLALEGPSYVARLSALAGRPIELLGQALPEPVSDMISRATQAALTRALRYALKTIPKEGKDPETRAHKALAVLSGAMGGALGVSAVLVELPISTTIMLRSIAWIAQSEGEDLEDPETALACVQVFALGGHSGSDNLHEAGYFAVRAAMAKSVTRALQQMAGRGVVDESTSAIMRLLAQIGSRFGVVVSQKAAAQAVPVLGAIGGAAVNAAFVDHFQRLARGHFTVRRLERTYGKGTVRQAYNQVRANIRI